MIYLVTRSLFPFDKTGGGLARYNLLKFFKEKGFKVKTVRVGQSIKECDHDFCMPNPLNNKLASLMQHAGILSDYLDLWVKRVVNSNQLHLKKNDIVFSTSGGELGTVILGNKLKDKFGARHIAQLHDPIDFVKINDLKINNKPHYNRSEIAYSELTKVDKVLTTTVNYCEHLRSELPGSNVDCMHLGYRNVPIIKKENNIQNSQHFNIAYIGNMSKAQSPEILSKVVNKITNKIEIRIHYIGDSDKFIKRVGRFENAVYPGYLQSNELYNYLEKNIDAFFLSLSDPYLGYCLPSKIFDYVGMGLPIIGYLPKGDCAEIIETNNFGVVANLGDEKNLEKQIQRLLIPAVYKTASKNLKQNRKLFSQDVTLRHLPSLIKALHEKDV